MVQTLALKDNYSVQIVPDTWEKTISIRLIDEVNNNDTLLATWQGGKWGSDSPVNMDKMFSIMKQYSKVKRATKKVFKFMKEGPEPSQNLNKKWSCFKRRFNVGVHNMTK